MRWPRMRPPSSRSTLTGLPLRVMLTHVGPSWRGTGAGQARSPARSCVFVVVRRRKMRGHVRGQRAWRCSQSVAVTYDGGLVLGRRGARLGHLALLAVPQAGLAVVAGKLQRRLGDSVHDVVERGLLPGVGAQDLLGCVVGGVPSHCLCLPVFQQPALLL